MAGFTISEREHCHGVTEFKAFGPARLVVAVHRALRAARLAVVTVALLRSPQSLDVQIAEDPFAIVAKEQHMMLADELPCQL